MIEKFARLEEGLINFCPSLRSNDRGRLVASSLVRKGGEKRRIIGCKSVPRKNNTGNCLMRGGDRVVEEDKLSFLKATFIRSSRPDKRTLDAAGRERDSMTHFIGN